jgi:hypothetical protein
VQMQLGLGQPPNEALNRGHSLSLAGTAELAELAELAESADRLVSVLSHAFAKNAKGWDAGRVSRF